MATKSESAPDGEGGGAKAFPLRWFLLGLGISTVFTAWLLHPLGTGSARIQGNVDTYLHAWNLWWVYQALVVEGHHPYTSTYTAYPHGTSLVYHSLILPLGLLSIPLFGLGWPASGVYLFWLYVFPAAGYAGMFLLVNRLRGPPAGSMTAGLYFVLMPFYWNHLSHPDRFCLLVLPWIVWSVLELRNRGAAWVFVPALLGSFLFLMSPYYAAGLMLLWLLGFGMVSRLNLPFWQYVSVGLLILLFTAFEWMLRLGSGVSPDPGVSRFTVNYAALLPNLAARLFFPPERMLWVQPLRGWFPYLNPTAGTVYPGIIALAILVYVSWCRWNGRVRWCVGVGLFFFSLPVLMDLVTRSLAGPGHLGDLLMLFRGPPRFVYFTMFFAALGVGFFRGFRRWFGPVVLLLLLLELTPTPVWNVRELPSDRALRKVRRAVPTEAVVPFPFTKAGNEAHYGQTVHGLKFPLGPATYVTDAHRRFLRSNPVLAALLRKEAPPDRGWRELRQMGYSGFIVHSFSRRPKSGRTFRAPVYQGLLRWSKIREDWRQALEERFGSPVLSNRFFRLYRFDRTMSRESRRE